MPTDSVVSYAVIGEIALITLNRPAKRNAINEPMAAQLEDAWARFDAGPEVVAVLEGSGESFCAGVDLQDPPQGASRWAPQLGVVTNKPIIAAIEGACIAGGMILLQNCDLAVASADSRFCYPEARIGFSKGVASSLAVRVPHKLAMELLLLGETVSAEHLFRAGLLNRVVAAGESHAVAMAWAERIAAADSACVQFIKAGVQAALPQSPGEIASRVRTASDRLQGNARANNGIPVV